MPEVGTQVTPGVDGGPTTARPVRTTARQALANLVLDRWADLSHKESMRGGQSSLLAPSWVPEEDRRRLTAYKVLAAYCSNSASAFLPFTTTQQVRDNRREYGEPDLIVERVTAGVLGDQVEVVVDGADVDLPDAPALPPEPEDPGPDASESDRIVFEARTEVWREESAAAVEEWRQLRADTPALVERQDWLRQWADDELLESKLYEGEHDGAVSLGDAVYVLGLDHRAGRPVIQVYDPGFYFPVRRDDDPPGYPRKVHLAWEFTQTIDGKTRTYVRRITWELVPLTEVPVGAPDDPAAGAPVMARRYPWQTAEEAPGTHTCLMTDATWPLEALERRTLDGFPLADARAVYATTDDGRGNQVEINRLDLMIDFIPVVHVPNTPASREHFGRSALARVLQLLDDLQATDTDVQAAAGLAAGPMIGASGDKVVATGTRVEPGKVLNLGPNGRMDVLDLSGSVKALSELVDSLLERLSVNVQVSGEILGRVDTTAQIAGITVALRFGPFESLVRVLRLVRDSKLALIPKFAQRLAQAGGYLDEGPTPKARIVLGSFLPSDRTATVELVVKLLAAHGISRRTALTMLVDAGLDIGDLAEELTSIEAEDFEGAARLADAVGDEQAAANYLGIDLPERPEAPPVLEIPEPPG